jgi:glucose-fructose oxidoreductase
MEHQPAAESSRPVGYAVVGLGHIAQNAVLPSFRHAKENSRLAALVSGDAEKLRVLRKKYRKTRGFSYDEYEECLRAPEVDAVYIALPNHLHCDYAVRAAQAGKHILCEKPMAVTEAECRRMIDAAQASHVRLMIAYRLHFERANLMAIERAQSGELGEVRFFQSGFGMQLSEGNVRSHGDKGGGTLYDIGIYCINAARNIFRDEPTEVFAFSSRNGDKRFAEIDEMTSAILRFPAERLAALTSSFGATDLSAYRIVGTKGDLLLDPAYHYSKKLVQRIRIEGKEHKHVFPKRDQFAAEIVYFSKCVREGKEPEPSGEEGLADVRVIEALLRSAREGRPVKLEPFAKQERPSQAQEIRRPPVSEPKLVHAEAPGS